MSDFSNAIGKMMGENASVDLAKVVEIVNAIVAAAPAIEKGLASAEPFIAAIVGLVKSGGSPSDADWASLRQRLDVGSAALQAAAQEAETETAPAEPDPSPAPEGEEE